MTQRTFIYRRTEKAYKPLVCANGWNGDSAHTIDTGSDVYRVSKSVWSGKDRMMITKDMLYCEGCFNSLSTQHKERERMEAAQSPLPL